MGKSDNKQMTVQRKWPGKVIGTGDKCSEELKPSEVRKIKVGAALALGFSEAVKFEMKL